MPNYAQAVPFLLASFAFAMPSSATTTGGGYNDPRLVRKIAVPFLLASFAMPSSATMRKIKNSKKEGLIKNTADTCTIEPFLGKSHYSNCRGKDTEVVIACDATETLCSYSEHPYPATSPVGCGDSGSFDPATYLIWDHATGGCRLKFLSLASTCVGVPASSGFGVMVEVPQNTGTGPLNHHGHNEDKNHKDNSGLRLRFSDDDGVTSYNDLDPRITVPLGESSPQRKLATLGPPNFDYSVCGSSWDDYKARSEYYYTFMRVLYGQELCPTDSLIYSTITRTGEIDPFQTCYKHEWSGKYCYSNSYRHDGSFYQCIPHIVAWHSIDVKYATSCGTPCPDVYEATPYPKPTFDISVCGSSLDDYKARSDYYDAVMSIIPREEVSLIYSTITWTGEIDPFQTCYKHGSDDKYCYSNSYRHDGSFFQCIPDDAEWHFIDDKNATSCGTPCPDVYEQTPSPKPICPSVNSPDFVIREADSLVFSTITSTGEKDPFQTCYKYGSGGSDDKYCYSNSYYNGHTDSFYQCIPNGVDWHAITTLELRLALMDTKCERPCQDLSPPIFNGVSTISYSSEKNPFQTCYKYGSDDKYCYSNSFTSLIGTYFQNVPNDGDWVTIGTNNYGFNTYGTVNTTSCGTPCQDTYVNGLKGYCPQVDSKDTESPEAYFRGYQKDEPLYNFTTDNQQTCFQYGSEDNYCWTNSYQYMPLEPTNAYPEYQGKYYMCHPLHGEGCGSNCYAAWSPADPKDDLPVQDSCGDPCQYMYKRY